MRLLVLSDVHGETEKLESLLEKAGEVDAVLLVGDLTDVGPAEEAHDVLDVLEGLPLFAVPGNCDPEGVEGILEERGVSVELSSTEVGDYGLYGIGGSNRTPFGTPREFTEDEIRERLEGAEGMEQPWILMSHVPPKNSVDITQGAHVGSEAVMEAVEELSPELVVSGHVHESKGDMYVGGTMVVNPGPVMDGNAAVVELNGETGVRYLKVR